MGRGEAAPAAVSLKRKSIPYEECGDEPDISDVLVWDAKWATGTKNDFASSAYGKVYRRVNKLAGWSTERARGFAQIAYSKGCDVWADNQPK